MIRTTIVTKIAQTTLLSTSLFAASAVWSCPEDAAAANAANPDVAQAQTPSVVAAAQLYAVLHDPALNKDDGLENYAEDYRAEYHN